MTDLPYRRKEQIGDAMLYLGDCLEVMPTLCAVDHVISDPPYGETATHSGHLSSITLKNGEPAGQALGFDGVSELEMVALVKDWCDLAGAWVVFTCEWKFCRALDDAGLLVRHGIWRKPDGAPQFTGDRPGTGWEAVAICHRPGKKTWNGGGRHAFWQFPKGENNSGHPTGKPISLYISFVKDFTGVGQTILDPFMGSGTTGVACAKLGRKFIGIELEEKYFDIACRRIEEAYRQADLFIPAPSKPVKPASLFDAQTGTEG
jgi:site-specific DNA-methyltransferase (adenine-specific)